MIFSFHYDDLALDLDCSKRSKEAERSAKPSLILWAYNLYTGMTVVKAARTAKGRKRRKLLAQGGVRANSFEHLARFCPENYLHSMYLLKAKLADLNGETAIAVDYYKKAIEHSRTEGFLHVLAMAFEYYGLACKRLGDASQAKDLIQQAVSTYREWGADAIASFKEIEFKLV